MNYDVVRVVEGRELRDIDQEAATLGVTVAALDTLDTIVRESSPVAPISRPSSRRKDTTMRRRSRRF